MTGYKLAQLEQIEEWTDGREPWRAVRHHLGITSFAINTWTGHEAGDRIINEHDESGEGGHEEVYFVHQGRARFEVDGNELDAPAGTFVYVERDAKRTAFAEEAGTTILAIGSTPGEVYEPGGWEVWAPLNALYQAGEYAEAADRGRALIDAHPEYAVLPYNVACCESLAGRTADAIEHLRVAIESRDNLRELAAEDSDFDAIRDEPAFKELVGKARAAAR